MQEVPPFPGLREPQGPGPRLELLRVRGLGRGVSAAAQQPDDQNGRYSSVQEVESFGSALSSAFSVPKVCSGVESLVGNRAE